MEGATIRIDDSQHDEINWGLLAQALLAIASTLELDDAAVYEAEGRAVLTELKAMHLRGEHPEDAA